MQTWRFQIQTVPLTPEQVQALTGEWPYTEAEPVKLTAHENGAISATVTATDNVLIVGAFDAARRQVREVSGEWPRIVALHGDLAGSVADVVFRAAAKLHDDESTILEAHLAKLWADLAEEMAAEGAYDSQTYDRYGNPSRKLVVKPVAWRGEIGSTLAPTWDLAYAAAKGYLEGHPSVKGKRP